MTTLLQRLEIAKDFAQTAIDTTVTAIENVHTAIADTSYQVMSQSPISSDKLKTLKETHDSTAGNIYSTIRTVNHSLGELASDYFESLEDSAKVADVMSKNNEKAAP